MQQNDLQRSITGKISFLRNHQHQRLGMNLLACGLRDKYVNSTFDALGFGDYLGNLCRQESEILLYSNNRNKGLEKYFVK